LLRQRDVRQYPAETGYLSVSQPYLAYFLSRCKSKTYSILQLKMENKMTLTLKSNLEPFTGLSGPTFIIFNGSFKGFFKDDFNHVLLRSDGERQVPQDKENERRRRVLGNKYCTLPLDGGFNSLPSFCAFRFRRFLHKLRILTLNRTVS
jgi:hypothetical protein